MSRKMWAIAGMIKKAMPRVKWEKWPPPEMMAPGEGKANICRCPEIE